MWSRMTNDISKIYENNAFALVLFGHGQLNTTGPSPENLRSSSEEKRLLQGLLGVFGCRSLLKDFNSHDLLVPTFGLTLSFCWEMGWWVAGVVCFRWFSQCYRWKPLRIGWFTSVFLSLVAIMLFSGHQPCHTGDTTCCSAPKMDQNPIPFTTSCPTNGFFCGVPRRNGSTILRCSLRRPRLGECGSPEKSPGKPWWVGWSCRSKPCQSHVGDEWWHESSYGSGVKDVMLWEHMIIYMYNMLTMLKLRSCIWTMVTVHGFQLCFFWDWISSEVPPASIQPLGCG